MREEIFIGRTSDGEKVYAAAEFSRQPGEWQTVGHETVTAPLQVAFSGSVVRKGGSITRDGDIVSSGQIDRSYLRSISGQVGGWSADDTRKLADLWDEWHLNTMSAGCAHQPPESVVYEYSRGYKSIDLDATPRCPVTGYKYGSAWLTRALPKDVAEWVSERFGIAIPD